MVRDFDARVAAFQIRAAVLNGDTALGMAVTEPVGEVRPEKGDVRASTLLRNKAPARRRKTASS